MNLKLQKIFTRYRKILIKRLKEYKYGEGAGTGRSLFSKNSVRQGNKTKNRILDFYEKNGRWPSRRSKSVRERYLGYRFENLVSKEAGAYDAQMRRIAMVSGRKTNNKRKHDVQGFKKQVIEFIEQHGRIPARYADQKIQGEGILRARMDYYIDDKNDMSFSGEIYSRDKCYRTSIPYKFRPLINRALEETEKPLIRMANYELKGEIK